MKSHTLDRPQLGEEYLLSLKDKGHEICDSCLSLGVERALVPEFFEGLLVEVFVVEFRHEDDEFIRSDVVAFGEVVDLESCSQLDDG